MDEWQQAVRWLTAGEVPGLVAGGVWLRDRGDGPENGTFEAVHWCGVWAVDGPGGRRLIADSDGELILEDGDWEVRTAGYGWQLAQPGGVLVRPTAWFPDLASAAVRDGPVDETIAGRPAHRWIVKYHPDARMPVTLWIDREYPLLMKAQAGDARSASEQPEFVAELRHLAEATHVDREKIDSSRRFLAQTREQRLADAVGEIVDEECAHRTAAQVIGAFGPDASLDTILAFTEDGHYRLKLRVAGEPVLLVRHGMDEHYRPVYGRIIRFGKGEWAYTIDDRGVLREDLLDDACHTLGRQF